MHSRPRGFTLIELLVVISLIGIISALSFGPINASQQRSRDSQRKADVHLIAQVLELYYGDERSYPDFPDCNPRTSLEAADASTWIPGLEPYITAGTYARGLPRDPLWQKNDVYAYQYACSSEQGKSFSLKAVLETKNDIEGVCLTDLGTKSNSPTCEDGKNYFIVER